MPIFFKLLTSLAHPGHALHHFRHGCPPFLTRLPTLIMGDTRQYTSSCNHCGKVYMALARGKYQEFYVDGKLHLAFLDSILSIDPDPDPPPQKFPEK